jgi:phosphotriesterase-related protein
MNNSMTGKVQTVTGPVSPDMLGQTLAHEHLLIDLECYFVAPEEATERAYVNAKVTMANRGLLPARWTLNLDQMKLLDEPVATAEAMAFRLAGGGTIVDVTSKGIGRDPLALARISRATGLNVVMGAGYYIPLSHPPDMDERTEESIYDEIVRDVTVGVGETGIRTGIIGELGNTTPLTDNSKKVLRAAGAASKATGAPISIHPGANTALEIIDILSKAGADPNRVAMGHLGMGHKDPKVLLAIVEAGAYAQFDHFGGFEDTSLRSLTSANMVVNDVQRLDMVERLIKEGYEDRLLFSHDVCWLTHLASKGGKGYAHVIESLVPRMMLRGWTPEQVDKILVANPARLLTFEAPA